jgi:hypothetical protein
MRMRHLPVDSRGYPVPWFVAFIDGKPDFRVVKKGAIAEAWNGKKCWLCGGQMGVFKASVIGPMCGINRVISEPPAHMECAEFAVKACPFISHPQAQRVERNLPTVRTPAAGMGIPRNPGVAMIWVTRDIKPFRVQNVPGANAGVLFKLGEPTSWSFWAEGRRATRAEIDRSVNTGYPLLEEAARKDGLAAIAQLQEMRKVFDKLLPSK